MIWDSPGRAAGAPFLSTGGRYMVVNLLLLGLMLSAFREERLPAGAEGPAAQSSRGRPLISWRDGDLVIALGRRTGKMTAGEASDASLNKRPSSGDYLEFCFFPGHVSGKGHPIQKMPQTDKTSGSAGGFVLKSGAVSDLRIRTS